MHHTLTSAQGKSPPPPAANWLATLWALSNRLFLLTRQEPQALREWLRTHGSHTEPLAAAAPHRIVWCRGDAQSLYEAIWALTTRADAPMPAVPNSVPAAHQWLQDLHWNGEPTCLLAVVNAEPWLDLDAPYSVRADANFALWQCLITREHPRLRLLTTVSVNHERSLHSWQTRVAAGADIQVLRDPTHPQPSSAQAPQPSLQSLRMATYESAPIHKQASRVVVPLAALVMSSIGVGALLHAQGLEKLAPAGLGAQASPPGPGSTPSSDLDVNAPSAPSETPSPSAHNPAEPAAASASEAAHARITAAPAPAATVPLASAPPRPSVAPTPAVAPTPPPKPAVKASLPLPPDAALPVTMATPAPLEFNPPLSTDVPPGQVPNLQPEG